MIMNHMKEYKGERIAASLTARLIPPTEQYSDSMCELILTERHLYVLEDNFNGTYETHFTFFMERIQALETEVKGGAYGKAALIEMIIRGALSIFKGVTFPSDKKTEDDGIRFVITYDDGIGKCSKLYFKDLQSNFNQFIKKYYELKAE